ncbi:MAG TPA: DUF805 domain-containing protein [bacterium]
MAYYVDAWRNYLNFTGRATRSHYWIFLLFNLAAVFVLAFVDGMLGLMVSGSTGVFSGLYILAAIIPGLAVGIRRLHDTGRSGWWFLIVFVPFVGSIILIVFFVMAGEPVANAYGPPPAAPYATT